MPNNRCTNCITYNHECTYVEAAKVRYILGLWRGELFLCNSPPRNEGPRRDMWKAWRTEW